MSKGICDVCGTRPASHRVYINQNGVKTAVELCPYDYAKIQQQSSTFDSLFNNNPFMGFDQFSSDMGYPLPRDREELGIQDYLSDHAKEIIQKAGEVAVKFNRHEVDSEHLLYALADSDVVEEILKQFKLSSSDLKGYIEANAPKGTEQKNEKEIEIGVSPRVKSAIQAAFPISRELGHGYIGPEHLLIALADEADSMAGDILSKYGLTSQALRQKIVKIIGSGAKDGTVDTKSKTPKLDKYSRDLSKMAIDGKLDPVIGRAKEIETTIEVLARRTKNNPVLIGEPGVGKTAIVEGLAQRISNGKVPQVLQDKRVIELNLNSVIAGAKYRGEFEERIKEIVDEIVENNDELIVFVDEIHTIVGAGQGGGEGGMDVANVLKPALARGELHLVGSTTLNEYQKYIEKDSALERRFQPVLVPEPTIDQTIEILRGLRDKYEAHHKIKITDEAIVSAVELSDRYITNRFLPDKAIDLIDQASARVRIGADTYSSEISELESQIAKLKLEQEYAASHKQVKKTKELSKELDEKQNNKDKLMEKWRQKKGVTSNEVQAEDIAQVISNMTGVPVTDLNQSEKEKLLKMEETLHKRVIGQEEAIEAVSNAVRLSRSGLGDKSKPISNLLFLGPTGVGKTELAKALAWTVFGDENDVIRIDMSEYMERHSVARLIGSPPGYVGYDEGGQLTEKVRRKPYCVLLLDEIEKAHPDVYNVLLQVFDDGRLTDGKGRVVDFTNTIIIATSNIGSDLILANLKNGKFAKNGQQLLDDLQKVLRAHFRPEFLNRIDEIIVFHSLTKEQTKSIVSLQLERVKQTAKGQGISLSFDPKLIDYLANVGYQPEYGARELKRIIKKEIENKLAKEILKGQIQEGSEVKVTFKEETVQFINKSKKKT